MTSINERAEQKVNDYLEHYGVKGMRWGVRKEKEKKEPETTISSTENIANKIVGGNFKESNEKKLKQILDALKDGGVPIFVIDSIKKYAKDGYYISGSIVDGNIEFKNSDEKTKYLKVSESAASKIKDANDKANSSLLSSKKSKEPNDKIPSFEGDSVIDKIKKIADLPISLWPAAIKKASLSHSDINELEDYIEHHGIFGQKWGVKHGPPYPLDRKTSKSVKNSGKITINVKNLSDEDLTRIVSRLNMEKRLKELTAEDTKKADSYAKKIMLRFRDTAANIIFKSFESAATAKLTSELKKKLKVEVNTESKKDKK